MTFTRFARSTALALALVGGGALVATPAIAKEKKVAAPKADYSKAFVAAYSPVNAQATAEAPDWNAVAAQLPAVQAAVSTDDDRHALGNLMLMIGQKKSDTAMQAQGLEMMLASGKVAADRVGLINFSAAQLAYNAGSFAKARDYMQKAMAVGYTDHDVAALVAETYFNEEKYAEGLTYLSGLIDARKAAGQTVDEKWIRRGLAIAYNNQIKADTARYAEMYVDSYPSKASWSDAVAILLNTGGYQNPEILDLLRLARRTNGYADNRVVLEYLDAADYRRLPAEVVAVIDDGIAKGLLKASDPFIADTRSQALARVAVDKRDLPNLMKDARAASAGSAAIMAAGDTLLSMGQAAEAEEFYTKALTVSGVDTPLVLTRLGIAQLDQGKFADAQATFGKVEGARKAIAALWSVYTRQKAAPAPTPAPAAQ